MRRVSTYVLVALACAVVLVPGNTFATSLGTEWNFTAGDYTPAYGTSTMSNWGDGTAAKVFIDTQSNLIGSNPASYIPNSTGGRMVWANNSFAGGTQGVAVSTGDANGGGSNINQWTLVMDVMAVGGSTYRSMADFSPADSSDTGLYRAPDGTIGWSNLGGNMAIGSWYRVALSVDAVNQTRTTYLNGTAVATDSGSFGGLDNAYDTLTANSYFLLFADNDHDLGSWAMANFYYVERAMSGAEIAALGGPSGLGIMPIPEPSTAALLAAGLIGWLAYAWRKRR